MALPMNSGVGCMVVVTCCRGWFFGERLKLSSCPHDDRICPCRLAHICPDAPSLRCGAGCQPYQPPALVRTTASSAAHIPGTVPDIRSDAIHAASQGMCLMSASDFHPHSM